MLTREEKTRVALLQGTLDLLILARWYSARNTGRVSPALFRTIRRRSAGGPRRVVSALQRLEAKGWVAAKWGNSENNRKARFYTLTKNGKKAIGGRDQASGARWRVRSGEFWDQRRLESCLDAAGENRKIFPRSSKRT